MKIGTERKKVILLVALLSLAGYLLYQQFMSPPDVAAPAARPAPAARQIRLGADEILDSRTTPKARAAVRTSNDFKPVLKRSKPGEGPDPLKMDPTLRTDLLAKVQAVNYEGVERNLFQFGAAKPKPTPQQIAAAKKEAAAAAAKAGLASDGTPAKPAEPTAPPVNMKYYGYAARAGDSRRRAFLMDGEEIIVAVEGEVIKKRYRVVRIGLNAMVVEDLQFKSQQTLPLQES
ncbi:MAG: hypothetical protein HY236_13530 [Acidobacteria bacterium]|nr:hypothetical protein [Acidobacteriota bacterium]